MRIPQKGFLFGVMNFRCGRLVGCARAPINCARGLAAFFHGHLNGLLPSDISGSCTSFFLNSERTRTLKTTFELRQLSDNYQELDPSLGN